MKPCPHDSELLSCSQQTRVTISKFPKMSTWLPCHFRWLLHPSVAYTDGWDTYPSSYTLYAWAHEISYVCGNTVYMVFCKWHCWVSLIVWDIPADFCPHSKIIQRVWLEWIYSLLIFSFIFSQDFSLSPRRPSKRRTNQCLASSNAEWRAVCQNAKCMATLQQTAN